MLAAAWILSACDRSNGLPSELTGHLARQGIKITPARVHAPSSSRGGYVVIRYTPQTATDIVATFKLERVQPGDGRWRWAVERAGGVTGVKELWGVTGRPAQFKLKNGGQFEYFFLLITEDSLIYLVAAYAYG